MLEVLEAIDEEMVKISELLEIDPYNPANKDTPDYNKAYADALLLDIKEIRERIESNARIHP